MSISPWSLLLTLLATFVRAEEAAAAVAEEATPKAHISFSKEVAPIFVNKCQTCHNAEKAKGGFRVDTFELLMKAGESKEAAIVPRDPTRSKIYQLITTTDPDDRMPQKDDPLPPTQIALIKDWIQQGAEFDRETRSEPLSAYVVSAAKVTTPAVYGYAPPILALAFDAAGQELAASGYGEVTFWDPMRGKLVRRIGGSPARIQALAYNRDGSMLAVCGGTPGLAGELAVLSCAANFQKRVLATASDLVLDGKFSPDGTRLASAGSDNSIRIYQMPFGRQELVIQQHADWVTAIAFSHDGKRLASASRDRSCRIFDVATGELEATYLGHEGPALSVMFTPDDKLVCSAGRDRKIHIWDVKEAKKTHEISDAEGEILQLAANAKRLFSCSTDKIVRAYDFRWEKKGVFAGHKDWVYALALDPAHNRLATGAFDGQVRLWDVESGELIKAFSAVPGLENVRKGED